MPPKMLWRKAGFTPLALVFSPHEMGRQVEDHFHHRGGVLVRHKLVRGALRLAVAVGRAGHILAVVALGVQRLFDLAGDVPQVDIIHGKLERL